MSFPPASGDRQIPRSFAGDERGRARTDTEEEQVLEVYNAIPGLSACRVTDIDLCWVNETKEIGGKLVTVPTFQPLNAYVAVACNHKDEENGQTCIAEVECQIQSLKESKERKTLEDTHNCTKTTGRKGRRPVHTYQVDSTAMDAVLSASSPEDTVSRVFPRGWFPVTVGNDFDTREKRFAYAKARKDPYLDPTSPESLKFINTEQFQARLKKRRARDELPN